MTTKCDSDVGVTQCAGCQNIKDVWREHCKNEVTINCNKLKEKHEAEKKELHKKIETLEKELEQRRNNDNIGNAFVKDCDQFRELIGKNKSYRTQAEELMNELMVELKIYNKLKVESMCQTDALAQISQSTQTERHAMDIDLQIQNIVEISNKRKQLEEAIETILRSSAPKPLITNENEESPPHAKRARIELVSAISPPPTSQSGNEQFEEANDSDASYDSDIQFISMEKKLNTGNDENQGSIDDNMHQGEQSHYYNEGDGYPNQVKQRTISGKENDIADNKRADNSSGQNLQEFLKSRNRNNNATAEDNNSTFYVEIMAKFEGFLDEMHYDPNSSSDLLVNDFLNYIPENGTVLQNLEYYHEQFLRKVEDWKGKQKSKDAES